MSNITEFRQNRRADEAHAQEQLRKNQELAAELELKKNRAAFNEQLELQRLSLDAKNAEAERERAAKAQKAEERLVREKAAAERKAQEDKERRREKSRRAKERRERWVSRVNATPAWLAQHLDLAAAVAVMACSIVPALVSQATSLSGTGILAEGWSGLLLVFLLPVMLECSAWAATAGEAKAMKEGRSPWPYRIAIYAFANLAGVVNFAHGRVVGGGEHGLVLGAILWASSVIPIVVWQLVQLGRHRAYRLEMKKAQQARKDEKETRERRQAELPEVWATAMRLRAVAGHGQLSEEAAWQAAFGVHEGAGSDVLSEELLRLLSADMLGLRVEAEGRLAAVWEELTHARAWRLEASRQMSEQVPGMAAAESVGASVKVPAIPPAQVPQRVDTGLLDAFGRPLFRAVSPQINTSVPPSARTNPSAPARKRETPSAGSRKASVLKGVRRLSPGAKRAAAETARTASAEENTDIEQWIRGQLQQGRDVKAKEVADETQRRRQEALGKSRKTAPTPGKTWCYDRIAGAKTGPPET